jgi:hypothetical protein
VNYLEPPYAALQRQTAVHGGGAAVLSSEEGGRRNGVVREHQRHTRSTTVVTVGVEGHRGGMAMCVWHGWWRSSVGTDASAHHWLCPKRS